MRIVPYLIDPWKEGVDDHIVGLILVISPLFLSWVCSVSLNFYWLPPTMHLSSQFNVSLILIYLFLRSWTITIYDSGHVYTFLKKAAFFVLEHGLIPQHLTYVPIRFRIWGEKATARGYESSLKGSWLNMFEPLILVHCPSNQKSQTSEEHAE